MRLMMPWTLTLPSHYQTEYVWHAVGYRDGKFVCDLALSLCLTYISTTSFCYCMFLTYTLFLK